MKILLALLLWTASFFAGASAPAPTGAKAARPPGLAERLRPLAELPASRRFPHLLDPATDVVMTLSATNAPSILGVAKVLEKSAVTLWVLYPESFDPLTGAQKPRVARALADLQKDLKAAAPKLRVEYQGHPYLQYPNPQDLGTFFWYAEKDVWRAGFADFNRGGRPLKAESWPLESARIFKAELPLEEPLLLVDRLKTIFHAELLRLPAPARDFDESLAANHGGNAALLPGGVLVTGASMPEAPRAELARWTGAAAHTLATGFLQQPLLSQAYAFVPAAGPCGYALVVASPLAGLELRRGEAFRKRDLDERLLETVFYFAKKADALKAEGPWRLEDFDLGRTPRAYRGEEAGEEFAGQTRYFDFVVQKTLRAEDEIQRAARGLADALKSRKACAQLTRIPVPVIAFFADEDEYFEGENGVGVEGRAQLLSPTPNLAVVGAEVLMGDFENSPEIYRKELRERTQKALEAGGVPRDRQHFIPSGFYNEGLGSLGGGLLVRRRPADLPAAGR